MVTVHRWTGRETRLLREAMRMSVRDFAAYLGISDRAVSKWERAGEDLCPRPDSQAVLDTVLARCPAEAKARFADALSLPAEHACVQAGISVDSHKFIPVFIGTERAEQLRTQMNGTVDGVWLAHSSAEVDHPDAAAECTLHAFACGVAMFHVVQHQEPGSLTDLALWRYRTYATDLPWAKAKIAEVLETGSSRAAVPEYVLSLYWLPASPWTGSEQGNALRLLSTPSVLVDRQDPANPLALDASVEGALLASGFEHPDIVSFGIRGVSVGYAGWSGVSYMPLSAERSLTIEELVACELTVQSLWCFCRQIQLLVEDGEDPRVPEGYGWRFLRAAHSRLTAARAQETAQHCLMREAIMKTSGLSERLRAGQEALRDSDGSRTGDTARWMSDTRP